MNELTTNTATISSTPSTSPDSADDRIHAVVQAIREKKGLDIVVLDISHVAGFADHFVLCTGTSSRHTQAIADEIERKLLETRKKPRHVEGYTGGEWILFDYGDFVVHVFTGQSRAFYDLERLWRDAVRVEMPNE